MNCKKKTIIDDIPEDVFIEYGQYLEKKDLEVCGLVSNFWYSWVHRHLTIFQRYYYKITHHTTFTPKDIQRIKNATVKVVQLDFNTLHRWDCLLSQTPKLILSNMEENFVFWKSRRYPNYKLKSLTIDNCPMLQKILINLDHCRELIIEGCPRLNTYPYLPKIKNIEIIGYIYPIIFPDFLIPSETPNDSNTYPKTLQELTLISYQSTIEPAILKCASNQLTYLDLTNCRVFDNLEPLQYSNTLKHLFLNYTNIENLSPLSNIPLETLDLSHCSRIRDVSPVSHVKYLILVKTLVSDISSLKNVEQLDLDYCHKINDFRSLQGTIRLSVIKTNFCDRDLQYLNDTRAELLILDARWTKLRNVDITNLEVKIINLEYCKDLTSFKKSNNPCISYLPKHYKIKNRIKSS